MAEQGWIKLRKGLKEHLQRGNLTMAEYAVYTVLHYYADYETGIYYGNAYSIAKLWKGGDPRVVGDALRGLRDKKYIYYATIKGYRGPYYITIHKYEPASGPMAGKRIDAFKYAPKSRDEAVMSPLGSRDEAVMNPLGGRDEAIVGSDSNDYHLDVTFEESPGSSRDVDVRWPLGYRQEAVMNPSLYKKEEKEQEQKQEEESTLYVPMEEEMAKPKQPINEETAFYRSTDERDKTEFFKKNTKTESYRYANRVQRKGFSAATRNNALTIYQDWQELIKAHRPNEKATGIPPELKNFSLPIPVASTPANVCNWIETLSDDWSERWAVVKEKFATNSYLKSGYKETLPPTLVQMFKETDKGVLVNRIYEGDFDWATEKAKPITAESSQQTTDEELADDGFRVVKL